MVKTNGKTQINPEELDLEHELPPADEQSGAGETAAAPEAAEAEAAEAEPKKPAKAAKKKGGAED